MPTQKTGHSLRLRGSAVGAVLAGRADVEFVACEREVPVGLGRAARGVVRRGGFAVFAGRSAHERALKSAVLTTGREAECCARAREC